MRCLDIGEYLKRNYGIYGKTLIEMAVETGYTTKSIQVIASRLRLYRNTIFSAMKNEEWVSLSLLNLSDYYISNYSRIKNKNGVLLKCSKHHQSGYSQIRLVSDSGKKVGILCHKVMYIAFNGVYDEERYQCDHIDGNRNNNKLLNITLLTPSENVKKQKKRSCKVSYLNVEEVKDICIKLELGLSISKIAETNNKYTKSRVEKIKQRIRWTKISEGYKF